MLLWPLFGLWPKLTEPIGFFQQLALLLPLVAFKPGNFDMMIFLPNLQLFLKGCTLSVLKSWQPASDFCEEGCFASLKKNFQILGSQSYRVELILFSWMQLPYWCHAFQYWWPSVTDCSVQTCAVEVVFICVHANVVNYKGNVRLVS